MTKAHDHDAGTAGLGVWTPEVRPLTAALAINVTLVAFESLSVATILPVVSRHLGDLRLYGWVFSAFFLASLLGIVAAGFLNDTRGITLALLGGLCLFAAGLAVAGLASNMPVLVAGRVVQGFGAGAVPASAYVAISRSYPTRAQPRMFAVLSTAWVIPGLVGPALAAQVAAHIGWRWVFLGLIPFTVAAAAMTAPAIAAVPRPAAPQPGAVRPPALLPALSVTAGAALILIALTAAGPSGLEVLATVAVAGIGGALLVPALARLTPPGTLRARPGPPAAVLSRGLLTFSFFAGDAYVPLCLTSIRHTSTTYAGVTLTIATMTWTGASWVQARLVARTGPRILVTVGLVLVLAGLVGLASILSPSTPLWVAPVAWGVGGFGIGLAYSPISLTTLGWAPKGEEGGASSSLQLTDVLGTAFGTGAAGAAIALVHHVSGSPRLGLGVAFALAGCAAIVGIAISPRLPLTTSPVGTAVG